MKISKNELNILGSLYQFIKLFINKYFEFLKLANLYLN